MALKNQEIGERISRLRQEKGSPPQPRVAAAVGVSLRTVQDWEAGASRPQYRNLEALAEYYGVTEDYILFGRTGPAEPTAPPSGSSASEEQVDDVAVEFRGHVGDLEDRLARIERSLNEASEERGLMLDLITKQNDLLDRQSGILEGIERLLAAQLSAAKQMEDAAAELRSLRDRERPEEPAGTRSANAGTG